MSAPPPVHPQPNPTFYNIIKPPHSVEIWKEIFPWKNMLVPYPFNWLHGTSVGPTPFQYNNLWLPRGCCNYHDHGHVR